MLAMFQVVEECEVALHVIGAGLGRTGTASLKLALEQLGFGPCYHMGEIIANLHFVPLWEQAGEGKPDWDTIFANYGSTTDYPACNFWVELMERYPEAKVILGVRDPASWFDSVNTTIMSPETLGWLRSGPFGKFFSSVVYKDIGDRIHDRAFMIDYFARHVAKVRAGVPPEKLLVFEANQGWGPLCRFLGVPEPDTDFPRVNSRKETAALLAAMIGGDQGAGMEDNLRVQREKLFERPS